MGTINVNYSSLEELGEAREIQALELETIRLEMLTTINSINDYWKGTDATNFINKSTDFLKSLSVESNDLYEWGKFFKKTSRMYGGYIDDGLTLVERMKLEQEMGMSKEGENNHEYYGI